MVDKILIVTDVTTPGGVDFYIINLIKHAVLLNKFVVLLIDEKTNNTLEKYFFNTSSVLVLKSKIYHRHYNNDIIAYSVNTVLSEVNPNIVHVVCGAPWSCLTVREVVINNNIPLIFTEQYIPNQLNIDNNIRKRIKDIYLQAKNAIFVSNDNKKRFLKYIDLKSPKSFVIYNGVDIKGIMMNSRNVRGIYESMKNRILLRFILASRFTEQKGIDLFIKAISIVNKTTPSLEKRLQVNIFGFGEQKDYLFELCYKYDLHDIVRFKPWSKNFIDELHDHDLFVLPSRSEGMPFSLLEAMASNIPIIASDIDCVQEALNYGKYGDMFNVDDAFDLSQKLLEWLSNPSSSLIKSHGREEWLLNNYDIKKNIDKTISFWNY